MTRSKMLMPLMLGTVLLFGFAVRNVLAAEEGSAPTGTAAAAKAAAVTYETIPIQKQMRYAFDNAVLFFCAVLVIFMQAGFAMVETGFNASKNAVNILFKNLIDFSLGALLFWFIGYDLMFPGSDVGNGWLTLKGFASGMGVSEKLPAGDVAAGTLFPQAAFLFQVAFAATAATIVSGAVAGRLKFSAYLIYSVVISGLVYPISGMWQWGGGWLGGDAAVGGVAKWFGHPFHDFAGSLVVHACGGFAGLAGAILLGPRRGRFTAEGKPVALPGHNLTISALGVFILWVGWYGFNPGSKLAFSSAENINATMLIAVNTTLAAAAGGVLAMFLSWGLYGKPDLSMALNGVLAGLVAITANCDLVTNFSSIAIGAIAGAVVIGGIALLDKLRIDDPVGAWPVHGLCGIWGGMATGIFGPADKVSMTSQIVGSIAIPLWSFVVMFVLFSIIKATGHLRVTPEEESVGLDISEHGMPAYGV